MTKKIVTKNSIWPALSIVSIIGFWNLSVFIILALKTNFNVYLVLIVLNALILPLVGPFLELVDLRKKLWRFWKSVPKNIHQYICLICISWGGLVVYKGLLPAIHKEYEKN